LDIPRLVRWNSWANRQVLDVLRTSGGEPAPALAAFQHVFEAEVTWLRRFEGSPLPMVKLWGDTSLATSEALFAEAQERWGRLSEPLAGPQALERVFSYRNSAGTEFTDRLEEPLVHTLLHSSQYRGESSGFLNAAGHRVPDLDLIFWSRIGAPE
jgi:uncharacterized damage-inducible protein DinB